MQYERYKIPLVRPDKQRMLDGAPMERCGHCTLLWPSDDMVETVQDNRPFRVCPNGASPSSDVRYEAREREQVAAELEYLMPFPRTSLMAMEQIIPPTVVSIEDSVGASVNAAHPLHILRSGTAVIVLIGVLFVAGDTVTTPAGITISSSVLTSTRKTLTLLAASDAPRGTFNMAFNGNQLTSVLLVR